MVILTYSDPTHCGVLYCHLLVMDMAPLIDDESTESVTVLYFKYLFEINKDDLNKNTYVWTKLNMRVVSQLHFDYI
jgi:hypothetical protein